jgi:hypothetical protein
MIGVCRHVYAVKNTLELGDVHIRFHADYWAGRMRAFSHYPTRRGVRYPPDLRTSHFPELPSGVDLQQPGRINPNQDQSG